MCKPEGKTDEPKVQILGTYQNLQRVISNMICNELIGKNLEEKWFKPGIAKYLPATDLNWQEHCEIAHNTADRRNKRLILNDFFNM